ncbi:hypothetical protein [Emcibacter sp. SYSU 3D8]|uniref:hypothetical protein n=1 Tax=Emcibacter sp. SYSU 3D8 TaxID=3133969 RepID=UPI0031FEE9ED
MRSELKRRTLLTAVAAIPMLGLLPRLARADGYEPPMTFLPSQILPPELQKGEAFEVIGEVTAQGFSNRYMLSTIYGGYDVVTQDLLEKYIAETRAIAQLRKIRSTKAFASGFASAAKSPYKGVKALIEAPVETVKGVPVALWKFGKRVGEMASGSRGDKEDSYPAELLGYSALKRKVAYKLGIDVYSANVTLQKEINDVSYASFAGGLAFKGAMIPVSLPAAAGKALSAVQYTRQANQILRDMTPEDLRMRNRQALTDMWAEDREIAAFMDNDYFTPRHETIITMALESMSGVMNRQAVIRRAGQVDSDLAALLMQRSVEMMRTYHATVRPIVRFEEIDANLAMVTADGGLAMAMPADRIHWTEWFATTTAALAAYRAPQIQWRGVVVAGQLSDRARTGAETQGLLIESNARATLLPAEEWEAPEPLEVDDETPSAPVDDPPAQAAPPRTSPESPADSGPAWQDVPEPGGPI